jgi:hypothetical protein
MRKRHDLWGEERIPGAPPEADSSNAAAWRWVTGKTEYGSLKIHGQPHDRQRGISGHPD